MLRFLTVTYATVLALAAGCGIDEFDVEQPVPEQRIEGSALPSILDMFFPIPVTLDLEAQIQEKDPGPIDAIRLKSLVLSITATAEPAGDADDWSFLSRVEVFVSSTRPDSTLPQDILVATAADPGATRDLVFVPAPGVNLKPYVDEGAQLTASAEGRVPADEVSFAGRAVFRVDPL